MEQELNSLLEKMDSNQFFEFSRRIVIPHRGVVTLKYQIAIAKFVLGI